MRSRGVAAPPRRSRAGRPAVGAGVGSREAVAGKTPGEAVLGSGGCGSRRAPGTEASGRRGRREAGWRQLRSASRAARSRNGRRRAAAVQGGAGPLVSVAVATVSMTTGDARAPEDLAVAMVPRG